MARCDPCTTNRALRRSQEKVEAARRELELELETEIGSEREEPMHRYTFPIPQPFSSGSTVPPAEEVSANLTQILEQLQCQNQLLADLLGAVNAMTAAVLCRKA